MQSEVPPKYFERILLNDDIASFEGLEQFREFILPTYQEDYNTLPSCQRMAMSPGVYKGIAEADIIQCFHFGYQADPVHIKRPLEMVSA